MMDKVFQLVPKVGCFDYFWILVYLIVDINNYLFQIVHIKLSINEREPK